MNRIHICPQCEAEYHPTVTKCADCHIPLLPKQAYLKAFEPLPFSEELVEVRTENASWVKNLAKLLSKAGIPSHIRLVGSRPGHPLPQGGYGTSYQYTLYVLPEHAEQAQNFELRVLGRVEDVEQTETQCPACGAARTLVLDTCPDCGLHFGGGTG